MGKYIWEMTEETHVYLEMILEKFSYLNKSSVLDDHARNVYFELTNLRKIDG